MGNIEFPITGGIQQETPTKMLYRMFHLRCLFQQLVTNLCIKYEIRIIRQIYFLLLALQSKCPGVVQDHLTNLVIDYSLALKVNEQGPCSWHEVGRSFKGYQNLHCELEEHEHFLSSIYMGHVSLFCNLMEITGSQFWLYQ